MKIYNQKLSPEKSVSLKPLTHFSSSFGLIEVVISTAMFIIFLGALILLMTTASKNNLIGQHRLVAANLARDWAEMADQMKETNKLHGGDFTNLNGTCYGFQPDHVPDFPEFVNSSGSCNYPHYHLVNINAGNLAQANKTIDSVLYTRTLQVDNINAGNLTNIKKINVRVSWNDFGTEHFVESVTYLTEW